MRLVAVIILTINQLTLVPVVSLLSRPAPSATVTSVAQAVQNTNITVIYKRGGTDSIFNTSAHPLTHHVPARFDA